MKKRGTRLEVWNGLAEHTGGGLTRDSLMMNRRGRIVSVARSLITTRRNYEAVHAAAVRNLDVGLDGEHAYVGRGFVVGVVRLVDDEPAI